MFKIAIVTRSMLAGGAERVISVLANSWVKLGCECYLFTIDNEKIFYRLDNKIKIIPIGRRSYFRIFDKFYRYRELRSQIVKLNPDIVLSMPEDIGIYVILALMGLKIPVVVSERNNPWVMPNKMITRLLRNFAYIKVNGLVFQTDKAASFFSLNIRNKGIILPNPLDLSHIPDAHTGIREKTIVSIGRLEKQKNFYLLIDAFSIFLKDHKDFKLIIYGEGSMRDVLVDYSRKKELNDCISFPGRDPNVVEKIKNSACFVLSSDYEGLPNALIEAMAVGVPCIATDCPSGGPASLITDGLNGFLVPVGDSPALSNKMGQVVDNHKISKALTEECIKIREIFDSSLVSKMWFDYLCTVIEKKP